MSKTIFIDTQFVIALINQRDQHHDQAVELAESYAGSQFLTTEAVLLEIGNALARRFRPQAVEVIDHFVSSSDVGIVPLTREDFDEALAFFKQHTDKTWSLTDCLSFVVMRQRGLREALTFDQHFVQAGFQALMRSPQ